MACEVEIPALDLEDGPAVEQRPLRERVGVDREAFEEVRGVFQASEEFELAGRELVGGDFGDDVGVPPRVFERLDRPVEVRVRGSGDECAKERAGRRLDYSQIPPESRSMAVITTTVSPMNTVLAAAMVGG